MPLQKKKRKVYYIKNIDIKCFDLLETKWSVWQLQKFYLWFYIKNNTQSSSQLPYFFALMSVWVWLKELLKQLFSNTNLLADSAFLCCNGLHKFASEMRRCSAKVNLRFIQHEKSFNLDRNKQPQLFIFISIH